VFGYRVKRPAALRRGRVRPRGARDRPDEKPAKPPSPYAVPGLYFYDNVRWSTSPQSCGRRRAASSRSPTSTALYLERGELHVEILGRGIAWLDTGTHESLLQAANFIQAIEQRQGLKVACIEEISFQMGFIDRDRALGLAEAMKNREYGDYLRTRIEETEAEAEER
jgi:glucose-1-phosphate thymidylyltransferase